MSSSLCSFFVILFSFNVFIPPYDQILGGERLFTNTYMGHRRPLHSRLTANIHPLNGTCHGSACPLTKDNCDLDKHWGENIKANVKSSFSSSVLRFTYNTTGTKKLQLPPSLRREGGMGCGGGRGRDRASDALEEEEKGEEEEEKEEDAGSLPASRENSRKSVLHKPAADSLGSLKATPPTHPPPHHLHTHPSSPTSSLTNTHTHKEKFYLEFLMEQTIINRLLLLLELL